MLQIFSFKQKRLCGFKENWFLNKNIYVNNYHSHSKKFFEYEVISVTE